MVPEKPKKTITAEFYRTDAGGEPARDFLRKELTPDERKAVGKDIRTVEYGWPIGMFSIYGSRMILLHGFVKKTQKTPSRELDAALERKRHLENRK